MAGETKEQMQERFEAEIKALNETNTRILEESSKLKNELLKFSHDSEKTEQQVVHLEEQLAGKDSLLDQQQARIGELESENTALSNELLPRADEPQYEGPEPEWRDVEGTVDQRGKLQALSIGRMDRPGVLLRYVTANNTVLSCAPYRDAKMVAGASDSTVSLSYAG